MLKGRGMFGSTSPMKALAGTLGARMLDTTETFTLKAARFPEFKMFPEIVVFPPGVADGGNAMVP
jgi:hypothetical protein